MAGSAEEAARLKPIARRLREHVIRMIAAAGSGHPGGSLSAAEIVTVLFFHTLRRRTGDPTWPERDRFVISKGHGVPILYAALAEAGELPVAELETLRKLGSRLQGHPDRVALPWVEAATGSLGQGLSLALGMALASRLDGNRYRVFCLLGDGETQSGQVWEAAMAAGKYKPEKLVVVLDYNKVQLDGPIKEIMDPEPLAEKWRSFNWNVRTIADGNDLGQVIEALDEAGRGGGPWLLLAHTVKGKGVSFMEGKWAWHGKAPTAEEAARALEEISRHGCGHPRRLRPRARTPGGYQRPHRRAGRRPRQLDQHQGLRRQVPRALLPARHRRGEHGRRGGRARAGGEDPLRGELRLLSRRALRADPRLGRLQPRQRAAGRDPRRRRHRRGRLQPDEPRGPGPHALAAEHARPPAGGRGRDRGRGRVPGPARGARVPAAHAPEGGRRLARGLSVRVRQGGRPARGTGPRDRRLGCGRRARAGRGRAAREGGPAGRARERPHAEAARCHGARGVGRPHGRAPDRRGPRHRGRPRERRVRGALRDRDPGPPARRPRVRRVGIGRGAVREARARRCGHRGGRAPFPRRRAGCARTTSGGAKGSHRLRVPAYHPCTAAASGGAASRPFGGERVFLASGLLD